MIVKTGVKRLLIAQQAMLDICEWRLYTDDLTITDDTVLADLTGEGAWSGYARQVATSWGTPLLVGTLGIMANTTFPVFPNSSGATVTWYVMALVWDNGIDPAELIFAENVGPITILDGDSETLRPAILDRQIPA